MKRFFLSLLPLLSIVLLSGCRWVIMPATGLTNSLHPKLTQITSACETSALATQWTTDTTFRLLQSQNWNAKLGCATEIWQQDVVTSASSQISTTSTVTESVNTCQAQPSILLEILKHKIGEVIQQQLSPNKAMLLIVAKTTAPDLATLLIGDSQRSTSEIFYQGWLFDVAQNKAQPLFRTKSVWQYAWTVDSQHIIIDSHCYGVDLGTGLYVIDTPRLTLATIQSDQQDNCEGSIPYLASPNSHYLLTQDQHGTAIHIDGRKAAQLCENNENARSYTWSTDSRFVYVACAAENAKGDRLLRYDPQSAESIDLVDPDKMPLTATAIAVSPNQKSILFIWRRSEFYAGESNGVWLLSLK